MNLMPARRFRLLFTRFSIAMAGFPLLAEANVIAYNFSETSTNDSQVLDTVTPKGPLGTTLWNDSYERTTGTVIAGSETGLVDDTGSATSTAITWSSGGTWYTAGNPGAVGDPAVQNLRIVLGYLDDSGAGISITVTNIPYSSYRVYGILASDQTGSPSTYTSQDFQINDSAWVFGGAAPATATALRDMTVASANGTWVELVPGVTPGNYWKVGGLSSPTLTIKGQPGSGTIRGSLAAIIIESTQDIEPDGMPDDWELANGLNVGVNDSALDADGDGLSNLAEYEHHTNPQLADTDGDGLSDGAEVNTYHTDPLVPDTDGDGLSDGDEVNIHHSSPVNPDTDGDELPDAWEVQHGLDPADNGSTLVANGASGDPDNDQWDNYSEFTSGTDPQNPDTDGDGLSDGEEANYLTNPLNPDSDSDGLSDGDEVNIYHTAPDQADSDSDGVDDGEEVAGGYDPNDASSTPVITTPITWVTQTDLLTDANISMNGTFVAAYTFGKSDVTVTIGGVDIPFTHVDGNSGNYFTGNGGTTGNTSLDHLLDSHFALEASAWNYRIRGLTPGKTYQVQVIAAADRRTGLDTRTQIFGDGLGNYTGDLTRGGPGTAIGTFTAGSLGTQTIDVNFGSVNPIDPAMSALIVREISFSSLAIRSFTLNPATQQFTFDWVSEAGRTYDVEYSSDLVNWSNKVNTTPVAATGAITSFTFAKPAAAARFFRVKEL